MVLPPYRRRLERLPGQSAPSIEGLEMVCPSHPGRLAGFPLPQYRDRDVHRTIFFDAGEGDAIVFVHGLGGNLTHWQLVAPALAASHRVVGLDLPGFGESLRPREPYSYDFMAREVFGLMDRRGLRRALVVGHSFGGAVATRMALDRPERVSGLVLVNPAGLHSFPRWMREGSRVALHPAVMMPALFLSVHWILGNVCRREAPGTRAFRRSATRLTGGWKFLSDLAHAAHGLRPDLMGCNFRDRLAELDLPIRLVWGEADRLLDAETGCHAVSQLPHAAVTRLPGVGHMPIFEQPESVIDAIRWVGQRAAQLASASSGQTERGSASGFREPSPISRIAPRAASRAA